MIDIKEMALQEKEYIISQRRYFHAHPELGREEIHTTRHIVEELQKMGIEVMTFDDITGCIGIIKGNYPGKTVALRADIDALPIQEADLSKEYASKNDGIMHACGHDCHTAMLLGAAKILSAHRRNSRNGETFIPNGGRNRNGIPSLCGKRFSQRCGRRFRYAYLDAFRKRYG